MTENATFVLHRRSELDPRLVERPDEEVIEAVCRWGGSNLSVRHLRERERFVVSCDSDERSADLHVSSAAIGGDSKTWVCIQQRAGRWCVCLPPAVRGVVRELAIERGELVVFWLGPIEVRVRRVRAGRAASRSGRSDRAMVGAFIGACVLSLTAIGLVKQRYDEWTRVSGGVLVDSADDADAYLRGLVERTERRINERGAGSAGARGVHDESPAGERTIEAQRGSSARGSLRVGTRGHRAVTAMPAESARAGVLLALGAPRGGSVINPFVGLTEQGAPTWGSASNGALGDSIADAFGYGGLGGGVTSVGASDGWMWATCGCMEWMPGLGANGVGVHTSGAAERAREHASGPLRERSTSGPRVCGGAAGECAPTVLGMYPRDTVRRVVRRNMGQFERCYEQSLARNPSSDGRVSVRFVMDTSGAVLSSAVESNSSGDALLGDCVARTFQRLQFDPPRESVVVVSFPMTFTSG